MAQHQTPWPVAVLWEVLEVRRSGFYAYLQRQASATLQWDELEYWRRCTRLPERQATAMGVAAWPSTCKRRVLRWAGTKRAS
jgi:hypothetical protein